MSSPVIQFQTPKCWHHHFYCNEWFGNQYNAINLGQGFPDYQMNEELMNKVSEVMQKGWNQYVPMQGYMPLRESIAEKVEYLYQTKIDPDTQITITPGGTYAIYTALTTILQPEMK
jgi:Aspartate/tyrosine/aromatic aminotransferase